MPLAGGPLRVGAGETYSDVVELHGAGCIGVLVSRCLLAVSVCKPGRYVQLGREVDRLQQTARMRESTESAMTSAMFGDVGLLERGQRRVDFAACITNTVGIAVVGGRVSKSEDCQDLAVALEGNSSR